MTPDISVIMPTYNRAQYIGEAIRCIRKQTHRNWELIIVNDGSTDDTRKIVEKFAKRDTRIQVHHQKNKGAAHTRNRAINLACADWVLGHDDDDISHPQLLEKYLQATQENPSADFIASHLAFMNPQGIIYASTAPPTSLAGSLLSRAKLKQVGLFRPFFPVAEDLDYFLRWQDIGMTHHFVKQKMYFYRRYPQNQQALSSNAQRYLYHFLAHYAQWCRQTNGSDPITDTTTLDGICAETQKLQETTRDNLVEEHLLAPYCIGRFNVGDYVPLTQIEKHLRTLGYGETSTHKKLQQLRQRVFFKRLHLAVNLFQSWSKRRNPRAKQKVTNILKTKLL